MIRMRHKHHPDVEIDLDAEHPLKDWELVKPITSDRWEDVTKACEFRILKDGYALSHHTGRPHEPEIGCNILVAQTLGYRLVKEQLWKCTIHDPMGIMPDQYQAVWAFRMERKA